MLADPWGSAEPRLKITGLCNMLHMMKNSEYFCTHEKMRFQEKKSTMNQYLQQHGTIMHLQITKLCAIVPEAEPRQIKTKAKTT